MNYTFWILYVVLPLTHFVFGLYLSFEHYNDWSINNIKQSFKDVFSKEHIKPFLIAWVCFIIYPILYVFIILVYTGLIDKWGLKQELNKVVDQYVFQLHEYAICKTPENLNKLKDFTNIIKNFDILGRKSQPIHVRIKTHLGKYKITRIYDQGEYHTTKSNIAIEIKKL